MEIEFIGSGAGLNPVLGNTAFVIRSNSDRTLLVDCGPTVTLELIKSGKLKDITDILITHPHGDHFHGLEGIGFMNYFAYKRKDHTRPNLYLGSEELHKGLWENGLKISMEPAQDDNGVPFKATLETYFKVHTNQVISIPGLPDVSLFRTPHVIGMESYGVKIGKQVWYSGDTVELPNISAQLIFQDCQFYETKSDVHISYDKLKRELSPEIKSRTYLVHLGGGWDKKDPKADGFAGFVKPGDKFNI